MKEYRLENIVFSTLTSKNLPIHYYVLFLHYAIRCLRELNFDTLGIVKVVKLEVDDTFRITLPDDFVDWTRAGYSFGQYVIPIGRNNQINKLRNTGTVEGGVTVDSTGWTCDDTGLTVDAETEYTEYTTYPVVSQSPYTSYYEGAIPYGANFYYESWYNYNGEPRGRWFGKDNQFRPASFRLIREDGQIQLDQNFTADYIILEYISDGLECDEGTECSIYVDPYAHETIEAFINWQFAENNRLYSRFDSQLARKDFYVAYKRLRARKFSFTKQELVRVLVGGKKQAYKT